ncbi:MAG: NH(3)-dependent synthetase, partial [Myxococcaceae bacterium]|nr:NH(3)-dependent synthetase [Myxococcaceae bacterium]
MSAPASRATHSAGARLRPALRPTNLPAQLRAARGFDADEALAAKVGRLRAWFAAEGLDAAVVGLSGGVDSALVLGLLRAAMAGPASPLRRVVALLLPVGGRGATGQGEATA